MSGSRRAGRERDPNDRTVHEVHRGGAEVAAGRPQGPPGDVVDRLAGLLPAEALEDALEGLEPEEITGPGRAADAARGPGDRDGAGRRADRAPGLSARAGAAGRRGQHPQRRRRRRRCRPSSGRSRSSTPRDRDGSFEPQLVGKRQTRLAGLDDRILGLYAGGMSVRDIARAPARALRRRDRPRHDQPRHRRGARGRRGVAHPAAGRASTRSSTSTA